jgi:hypothetical protein
MIAAGGVVGAVTAVADIGFGCGKEAIKVPSEAKALTSTENRGPIEPSLKLKSLSLRTPKLAREVMPIGRFYSVLERTTVPDGNRS